MHALITGGCGYIGTELTAQLNRLGHKVTTLDSNFNSVKSYKHDLTTSHLRRFAASVNNIDRLAAAMSGVDVVYHLAARMDSSPAYRHIMRLTDTNVGGTANVVAMCRKVGVPKIVFTSTAAVYGNLVGAMETDLPKPINLYGATKLAAEAVLEGAYQEGLEVVILRLFNVWGGVNSRSVVKKFCDGGNVIYEDGSQTRDFVHVSDVVTALINASVWDSNKYNIGTGVEVSIGGLHAIIRGEASTPRYEPSFHVEIQRSLADTSFTFAQTGWLPKVLISELTSVEICKL